jgi:hypothetical protein
VLKIKVRLIRCLRKSTSGYNRNLMAVLFNFEWHLRPMPEEVIKVVTNYHQARHLFLSQLKCKNLGRKQRDTFQKVEFPQTNLTWSLVCIAIVRLMMSMRDIRIAATTHLSGEIV